MISECAVHGFEEAISLAFFSGNTLFWMPEKVLFLRRNAFIYLLVAWKVKNEI